jgi:hypothetical protein
MRAKPDYKAAVTKVIRDEFAETGYILSKSLAAKIGKLPPAAVREHFADAVAAIPDREEVKQAYEEFLDLACAGEVTDELVAAGAGARLTAERIADAISEVPEVITRRARALGLKLAGSEHAYAAASRLTPQTARRLMATGMSKARLMRITAVPYPTLMQRLEASRDVVVASTMPPKQNGRDQARRGSNSDAVRPRVVDASATNGVAGHASVKPIMVHGFRREAINLAARQILMRDGHDPDALVAGIYVRDDRDGEPRLECDRIEMVEGRPTPHVAMYRLEAEKIASILTLVEQASASTAG